MDRVHSANYSPKCPEERGQKQGGEDEVKKDEGKGQDHGLK